MNNVAETICELAVAFGVLLVLFIGIGKLIVWITKDID